MKILAPDDTGRLGRLEQLLTREDIWRGQAGLRLNGQGLPTGFEGLDNQLRHGGWPLNGLIEICQAPGACAEWQLLAPALAAQSGYIVLLNPPATPFAATLIQTGINLDQVLVVQADKRGDFLGCFAELTQSAACSALMAWEPDSKRLNYTDLRKCLLASKEGHGLYTLFRTDSALLQSSPASLRLLLRMDSQYLQIQILKQQGALEQMEPVLMPLPSGWLPTLPHHQFDQTGRPTPHKTKRKATMTPLRGGGQG